MSNGLLAFDADDRGGEWYSSESRPDAEILYPVACDRVAPHGEVAFEGGDR